MNTSERIARIEDRIARPFLRNDRGANELLGFALLAILIVLGSIAILGDLGDNMVAKLTEINAALTGAVGSGTTTTTTTTTTN